MPKSANDLVFIAQRTDGASKSGDMTSGDGNAVPSRAPVFNAPTLGNAFAPAAIVGDMVAGMPNVDDNSPTPDRPAIEKVMDSCCTLPRSEIEP